MRAGCRGSAREINEDLLEYHKRADAPCHAGCNTAEVENEDEEGDNLDKDSCGRRCGDGCSM